MTSKASRPPPLYHRFERDRADGSRRPWPTMPKAPEWIKREPARRPPRIGAYMDSRMDPMEILARLAGCSTFRTPNTGRSTRGNALGTDDIAHALGKVEDKLEQCLARALACQTDVDWNTVQALAYPLLHQLLLASHNTRGIITGAYRYRIRLVLHDVFHDRALLRPARFPKDAARKIRMAERDYRALYKAIDGFVETRAHAGAYAAWQKLFGSE